MAVFVERLEGDIIHRSCYFLQIQTYYYNVRGPLAEILRGGLITNEQLHRGGGCKISFKPSTLKDPQKNLCQTQLSIILPLVTHLLYQ